MIGLEKSSSMICFVINVFVILLGILRQDQLSICLMLETGQPGFIDQYKITVYLIKHDASWTFFMLPYTIFYFHFTVGTCYIKFCSFLKLFLYFCSTKLSWHATSNKSYIHTGYTQMNSFK